MAALVAAASLLGPSIARWTHARLVEYRINRYTPLIETHARANGLSVPLVRAIIRAESGGRPGAVSARGAKGLMQVMEDAEREVLTARKIPRGDLFNPEYNIAVGTAYLSRLLRRFGNDPWRAVAAYHAGPTRIEKLARESPGKTGREIVETGAPRGTVLYVRAVMERAGE
ncbi:MAG: lytic transglycosylase domain-containing protein [Planctomycetota bacterium]